MRRRRPRIDVESAHGTGGLGDLVCFPSGPEGAHALRGPGRIVIFSTGQRPSVSVYPDSDKVGVRAVGDEEPLNFRRGDAVDYWEGE